MEERDWARLIAQLREGDCTPFLGAGACRTLPTGPVMSRQWAEEYGYPFTDRRDLTRVMQYAAFSVGDTVSLKRMVCNRIKSAPVPNFADPSEPHALLAEFPIPSFVTTNYDDFLVKALERAGKHPNPAVCSWHEGTGHDRDLLAEPTVLTPTAEHPLVYHLHGSTQDPKSIVLTERDYLEFLVKIATSRNDEALNIIPSAILSALTDKPLLFIGYSLQAWTFNVLFHGLLRTIPDIHRRRSVSVQLLPPVGSHLSRADAEDRARDYLTHLLEDWHISIFWGTTKEFCQELRRRASALL